MNPTLWILLLTFSFQILADSGRAAPPPAPAPPPPSAQRPSGKKVPPEKMDAALKHLEDVKKQLEVLKSRKDELDKLANALESAETSTTAKGPARTNSPREPSKNSAQYECDGISSYAQVRDCFIRTMKTLKEFSEKMANEM